MKQILYIYILVLAGLLVMISCSNVGEYTEKNEQNDYLKVPEGFPPIPYPEDNPITPAKVQLGRFLYYEKMLSKDSTIASCSHCMKQEYGFADKDPKSLGFGNEGEFRNVMSLANAAYRTHLFWDGRGSSIEQPAYRSMYLPFVFGGDTNEINRRLENHPIYPALFKKAFGKDAKPSAYLASKAIATFVRTLISGNSRYDKFKRGDSSALNVREQRGMSLFFSERTRCSACHSGFMFTDGKFHNTGTTTHYFDRGRFYITENMKDLGKFITPTLRNIEVTAPYLHNGDVATLEGVLEIYNRGGHSWLTRDTLIKPINLSKEEIYDLISFLKSLTDTEFLNNPKFMKPEMPESLK